MLIKKETTKIGVVCLPRDLKNNSGKETFFLEDINKV